MFLGALRSVIRPVSRTISSPGSPFTFPITPSPSPAFDSQLCHHLLSPFKGIAGGIPASNAFHSAILRAAGTARRSNEKRRKPHPVISPSERKKLKAQIREANRRKNEECRLNYHMIKEIREEAREVYKTVTNWFDQRTLCRWKMQYSEDMKKDPVLAAMFYYKKIQRFKLQSKRNSVIRKLLEKKKVKYEKRTGRSSITGRSRGLSARAGGIGIKTLQV